jgi:hypothetical protein
MKFIMLILAAIIDILGLACFFISLTGFLAPVAQVFSMILDFVGLILIGGWILFSGGTIPGKIASRLLTRVGLAFLVESIPFLGDISPSWTLAVLSVPES